MRESHQNDFWIPDQEQRWLDNTKKAIDDSDLAAQNGTPADKSQEEFFKAVGGKESSQLLIGVGASNQNQKAQYIGKRPNPKRGYYKKTYDCVGKGAGTGAGATTRKEHIKNGVVGLGRIIWPRTTTGRPPKTQE